MVKLTGSQFIDLKWKIEDHLGNHPEYGVGLLQIPHGDGWGDTECRGQYWTIGQRTHPSHWWTLFRYCGGGSCRGRLAFRPWAGCIDWVPHFGVNWTVTQLAGRLVGWFSNEWLALMEAEDTLEEEFFRRVVQ